MQKAIAQSKNINYEPKNIKKGLLIFFKELFF
jgi:hypothetical protein